MVDTFAAQRNGIKTGEGRRLPIRRVAIKPLDFKNILQSLAHLSHWQRDRLVQVLSQRGESHATARIEACFDAAPKCPHFVHSRFARALGTLAFIAIPAFAGATDF